MFQKVLCLAFSPAKFTECFVLIAPFNDSVNIKQLIEKLGRQGFSKKVLLYKVQQFVKNNFLKITYKYWEVVDMTLFE